MRGQYSVNRCVRPRNVYRTDHDDAASARMFVCMGCRAQVLICRCCDRGQIYCAGDCARRARPHTQRVAGQRHQTSRRGRLAHAERARRYRARCKNVTHHGSPASPLDDLLLSGSPAIASGATASNGRTGRLTSHCHWCGRRCPDLVTGDLGSWFRVIPCLAIAHADAGSSHTAAWQPIRRARSDGTGSDPAHCNHAI
jgi:hypothetical protein